ncbi:helix-turn-helix domain-containing protein [Paenibacillus sp. MBLB4367]|uniref:AraC family transcriptional regulator n=1 Tax=Paenibacillus sp. MBLB4367 TaxID=3384767 RepID=UPI0039081BAF
MDTQFSSSYYMQGKSFAITRVVHDLQFRNIPSPHSHDFVELVYVVRGEAIHMLAEKQVAIEAGDLYIIKPGEIHTYDIRPGRQLEIINCMFMPDVIRQSLLRELDLTNSEDYFYVQLFLDNEERLHHRLQLKGRDAEAVFAILKAMLAENVAGHPSSQTINRLKLMELLIRLSRIYEQQSRTVQTGSSDKAQIVRRVRGFLERHYQERILISSITELFSISERQLNRLFKAVTGHTVIEMLHRIRIEHAKRLLAETDAKVITIATLVGYDDPSFFSRLFARLVGCAPGQYRASPDYEPRVVPDDAPAFAGKKR